MSINVIIAKPTRACNANCDYCCAYAEDKRVWSFEQFKVLFDRLKPAFHPIIQWIWHGGEPLLLAPDFYQKASEYAWSKHPTMRFAIQSNILLYERKKWLKTIQTCFNGNISTSFDPDEKHRKIAGSSRKYTDLFKQKLDSLIEDGLKTCVIGVFNEENVHLVENLYELSAQYGEKAFSIKYNYMYPAGKNKDRTLMIKPESYTKLLLNLWHRWKIEAPCFSVYPLADMLSFVLGIPYNKCPWIKNCGSRFLSIEPNGDLYTCSGFADTKDPQFLLGNALNSTVCEKSVKKASFTTELLSSPNIKKLQKRCWHLPKDCLTCPHLKECNGGCQKDTFLFTQDLSAKFPYCETWKTLFAQIKADVANGKANKLIEHFKQTTGQPS